LTAEKTWKICNTPETGNSSITQCNAVLGTRDGYNTLEQHASFSTNNFSINAGECTDLNLKVTGLVPGSYGNYLNLTCAVDVFGKKEEIQNRPIITGFVTQNIPEVQSNNVGGGGGGGFTVTPKKKEESAEETPDDDIQLQDNEPNGGDSAVIIAQTNQEAKNNELNTQVSKATGYLQLVTLESRTSKIVLGALCGMLIVIAGVKFGVPQLPNFGSFKKIVIESKPKIQRQTPNTQRLTLNAQSLTLNAQSLTSNTLKEEPKLNNHMSTVLKALHPREQEIMRTIVDHGGRATQARIYHATGIPTTSLSRWMDKLERKGLIESMRRGKLRDLKLTKKFLGE
ncbi:MAG: hypothetical protein ABIF92_03315, partial [archaeon]